MYGLRDQRVPGMQVHAVPEAERAIDNSGRRLPWAYDYKGPVLADHGERAQLEKGPFGRSMRRSRSGASRSRSKTAEPRREEDKIKAENTAAEDAIFGTLRRVGPKDEAGKREALGEPDNSATGIQASRVSVDGTDSEPTEVLLYGFGEDLQWAAIDFYERVSSGYILEDYDRQPPGQRYDVSRTMGRAQAQRSLSRAAMRKKNKFAGGEHWIKVTFESRQAAELAIARQPHTIRGYLVYAEPYQGRGPQKDEPVLATQAGAQITSDHLPKTFSTNTGAIEGSPNGSSTASSATATAHIPAAEVRMRHLATAGAQGSPSASSSTLNSGLNARSQPPGFAQSRASGLQVANVDAVRSQRLRIDGAIPAQVLPAELALAPKQPKPSWTSWIGASEIIGSAVPRKEDGTFDWERASLYWLFFAWLDWLLGTDMCGLKADE